MPRAKKRKLSEGGGSDDRAERRPLRPERLRVVFSEACDLADDPTALKRWVMVPSEARTIGDWSQHLAKLCKTSGRLELKLDGWVLPSSESLSILRESDQVEVHCTAAGASTSEAMIVNGKDEPAVKKKKKKKKVLGTSDGKEAVESEVAVAPKKKKSKVKVKAKGKVLKNVPSVEKVAPKSTPPVVSVTKPAAVVKAVKAPPKPAPTPSSSSSSSSDSSSSSSDESSTGKQNGAQKQSSSAGKSNNSQKQVSLTPAIAKSAPKPAAASAAKSTPSKLNGATTASKPQGSATAAVPSVPSTLSIATPDLAGTTSAEQRDDEDSTLARSSGRGKRARVSLGNAALALPVAIENGVGRGRGRRQTFDQPPAIPVVQLGEDTGNQSVGNHRGWKRPYEVIASVAAPGQAAGELAPPDPYAMCESYPEGIAPHVNDVIAFKVLSLPEGKWEPELSEYRCAKVTQVEGADVMLLAEGEGEQEEEQHEWSSLAMVKIISGPGLELVKSKKEALARWSNL